MSARLIVEARFDALFVSGYGLAASKGFPDTGLLSYREVLEASQAIVDAARLVGSLPGYAPVESSARTAVICDADTGYGNEMNVRRTVCGFHAIGASAIMIEDQVSPKRCGHAQGKTVVSRDDAVRRVRAACEARDEACGGEIGIIARTDARGVLGLDEALARARAFEDAGADVVFVEAPQSLEEMRLVARASTLSMANMLLGGRTPERLSNAELKDMGFALAAYPFDMLIGGLAAMRGALAGLRDGRRQRPSQADIDHLWDFTGFNAYREREKRYRGPPAGPGD